MRVIVACRLSKLKDGSTGLDTQEAETVRWAEAQGHVVVAVVKDAVSGARSIIKRTKLRPWLTDPEHLSRYDGVVVYKMDRLTRGDSKETRAIETWADDNAKTLMTADGLVFPCEGADGIRWDLAKRLAHDEWLRIQERYGRMQADVRSRGGYIGKLPFGMALVKNSEGAKVLAHGDNWPLAVEAFQRAPKQPVSVVGAWLKEQTGDPWHARSVIALLRNDVYSTIPGFAEAQAVLDARGSMGRGVKKDSGGEKALLSALLCGNPDCDASKREDKDGNPIDEPSPMYRVGCRGTLYYRCAGRGPRRHGCGNMIKLQALDALMLGGLDIWEDEQHEERVFIPGNDVSEAVDALKGRLPYAKTRKDADALWDAIEALEAKGSTPAEWKVRDSGMTVGEYLLSATLTERRTFLASKDIRAWHEGARILVTVDGAVARKGGSSAIKDITLREAA